MAEGKTKVCPFRLITLPPGEWATEDNKPEAARPKTQCLTIACELWCDAGLGERGGKSVQGCSLRILADAAALRSRTGG